MAKINWEAEAAKLRKLYQKQLEKAKDTHNAILSLTNDVRNDNPEADKLTLMYVDKHITRLLEKQNGKSN